MLNIFQKIGKFIDYKNLNSIRLFEIVKTK